MKDEISIKMTKGGMIARINIAPEEIPQEEKWKHWGEVHPLRLTGRGSIGFNFSREANQLLSIQILYAKYCLPRRFTEYSEYYRDGEESFTRGFLSPGHQYIRFEEPQEAGTKRTQVISFNEPNPGTAIIDSYNEETISSIELVGFN